MVGEIFKFGASELELGITVALLFSQIAMTEFVVSRSIPTDLPICNNSSCCLSQVIDTSSSPEQAEFHCILNTRNILKPRHEIYSHNAESHISSLLPAGTQLEPSATLTSPSVLQPVNNLFDSTSVAQKKHRPIATARLMTKVLMPLETGHAAWSTSTSM